MPHEVTNEGLIIVRNVSFLFFLPFNFFIEVKKWELQPLIIIRKTRNERCKSGSIQFNCASLGMFFFPSMDDFVLFRLLGGLLPRGTGPCLAAIGFFFSVSYRGRGRGGRLDLLPCFPEIALVQGRYQCTLAIGNLSSMNQRTNAWMVRPLVVRFLEMKYVKAGRRHGRLLHWPWHELALNGGYLRCSHCSASSALVEGGEGGKTSIDHVLHSIIERMRTSVSGDGNATRATWGTETVFGWALRVLDARDDRWNGSHGRRSTKWKVSPTGGGGATRRISTLSPERMPCWRVCVCVCVVCLCVVCLCGAGPWNHARKLPKEARRRQRHALIVGAALRARRLGSDDWEAAAPQRPAPQRRHRSFPTKCRWKQDDFLGRRCGQIHMACHHDSLVNTPSILAEKIQ